MSDIQYISDENGTPVGVIVPIDLWREIESERETAYLLKSENMKRRLLKAKNRSARQPRQDWEAAFRAMADSGDDELFDKNVDTQKSDA